MNPGYAQGLHWYALYLASRGRSEESITEIKLAHEIDPRSQIINANIGWCYYLAGEADKAIEAEKETLRLDPSFGVAYGYLSQAYADKGTIRGSDPSRKELRFAGAGRYFAARGTCRGLRASGEENRSGRDSRVLFEAQGG